MSLDVTVTDQFCGAGGSSIGAEAAGGTLRLAMNHWQRAIETHNQNFPNADHVCADISATDPRRYPRTDILITSPECTNHSIAKTRRPGAAGQEQLWDVSGDEERSRATMWDVPRFAEQHRYEIIIVENVVEAAKWELFDIWVAAMTKLGYDGRPVFLNSMVAPPTPQSRDRMYYVWWRRGNRPPDLDFTADGWCLPCGEIVPAVQSWKPRTKAWPIETWGKYRTQYIYRCPNCAEEVLPFAHPAFSAIDWSIKGQRIGDRDEPLKPATMSRIQRGLEKYGHLPPLLIPVDGRSGKDGRPVTGPMPTQTARLESGVLVQVGGNTFEREGYVRATPLSSPGVTQHTSGTTAIATLPPHFLVKNYGGIDEAKYRSFGPDGPFGAVTTSDSHALVAMPFIAELRGGSSDTRAVTDPLATMTASGMHHMLTVPPSYYVKNYGPGDDPSMAHRIEEPLGAVTTQDHHALVSMPMPILAPYYNTGVASAGSSPAGALTTRDRHALVQPAGQAPAIEDCTFRMLEPHEIGRAMAFPDSYVVVGNKRERVRQYGNAVTPPAMAKLLERCIASLA